MTAHPSGPLTPLPEKPKELAAKGKSSTRAVDPIGHIMRIGEANGDDSRLTLCRVAMGVDRQRKRE